MLVWILHIFGYKEFWLLLPCSSLPTDSITGQSPTNNFKYDWCVYWILSDPLSVYAVCSHQAMLFINIISGPLLSLCPCPSVWMSHNYLNKWLLIWHEWKWFSIVLIILLLQIILRTQANINVQASFVNKVVNHLQRYCIFSYQHIPQDKKNNNISNMYTYDLFLCHGTQV